MRGALVPKFVVTKSPRSESHLALGLQNVRAFANSRGHVPQCPMSDDVTDDLYSGPKSEKNRGVQVAADWHQLINDSYLV